MSTGYVRGAKRDVLHFLKEHPNQVITLQDLMEAMPQWEDRQLLATMNGLLKSEFEGLIKTATGVWKYETANTATVWELEILKETEEYWLCTDKEGSVYRVTYLG